MLVSDVDLKSIVIPCPKCGLQSGDIRGSYQTSDADTHNHSGWYYALAECPGCEHPFLTRHTWCYAGGGGAQSFDVSDPSVLYPSMGELDESVPPGVAHSFTETLKTASGGSAIATAIMCRRTLEAVCVELGATEWGLKDKLKELGDGKKLDPRLLEWAGDVLKPLGDDAAHIKADIEPEDAKDAVEFTRALIHNLFVLPLSLDRFKKRRLGKT